VNRCAGARSRLPGPVIFGHVLLALTGLVTWVISLLTDSASMGWAAL
jgi:manganese efflux pump family protein